MKWYGILSRPYHFQFLNGCLPQISLGPFLNTLSHISIISVGYASFFYQEHDKRHDFYIAQLLWNCNSESSTRCKEKCGTILFCSGNTFIMLWCNTLIFIITFSKWQNIWKFVQKCTYKIWKDFEKGAGDCVRIIAHKLQKKGPWGLFL